MWLEEVNILFFFFFCILHNILILSCLGIRPFPYTTDFSKNPQTFAYINREGYNQDFNVHAKGSVWCTILFEGLCVF